MMCRSLKSRIICTVILLLVTLVGSYNLWSYTSGHTTAATLLTFSLPAKLLLVGIVVASVFLQFYKTRKRQSLCPQINCPCGSRLRGSWFYCPACGRSRDY